MSEEDIECQVFASWFLAYAEAYDDYISNGLDVCDADSGAAVEADKASEKRRAELKRGALN